jgi:hypothetical protein
VCNSVEVGDSFGVGCRGDHLRQGIIGLFLSPSPSPSSSIRREIEKKPVALLL